MSRHAALQKFSGEKIKQELHDQNIELRSRGLKGIAEEAPGVYKDVDEVIRVTDGAGIGKKVVRVTPLAVIKG
jgi:tRNA-splicing ligase RtcB